MPSNGDFLYYLGMLVVFVVILAMAWLTARILGRRGAALQSKSMKVEERLMLGMDRGLLIVRVGARHYLFVSTRTRLDFVAEVFPEEIQTEEGEPGFDFKSIFDRYSGLSSRSEPRRTRQGEGSDQKPGQAAGNPDAEPEASTAERRSNADGSVDAGLERLEPADRDSSGRRGIAENIRRMRNLTRR